MRILFLVLVLAGLAGGCSHKLAESSSRTSKDSVFIREREYYRDTVIIIKGDTARLKIPARDGRATASDGRATVNVQIAHDTVYATASCDEAELKLQLKNKEVEIYKHVYDSLLTAQTFLKFKVPDSVKWLAIFGALCLVLMLIYIIYLIKK